MFKGMKKDNKKRKNALAGGQGKVDKAAKKKTRHAGHNSTASSESCFPLTSKLIAGRGRAFVAQRAVAKGEVVLACEPAAGVLLPHCVDSHCAACFRPVDGGDGVAASEVLTPCPKCCAVSFCPGCANRHRHRLRAARGGGGTDNVLAGLDHSPRACAALQQLSSLVADGVAAQVLSSDDDNSSSGASPESDDSEFEDGLNMAQLVLQLLCRRIEEDRVTGTQEANNNEDDLVSACTSLSRPVVVDTSARAVDALESHFDEFPQSRQDHFRGVATLVVRAAFAEEAEGPAKSSGIIPQERAQWETWAAETCARVVCNGHGVSHDGQWAIPEAALALGNRAAAVALYTSGSLFNHACAPSCAVAFDGRGRLAVRALVALHPGDEATLSYSAGLAPRAARAADLAGTYFFTCQCAKCTAVEAAGAAIEQERSGSGGGSSSSSSDEPAARVWGAEEDMNDLICRCGGALALLPPGKEGSFSKSKKKKKKSKTNPGSSTSSSSSSSNSGNLEEATWACMACRKKQAIDKHFAALGTLQEALAVVAQELAGVVEEESEDNEEVGEGSDDVVEEGEGGDDGEGSEVDDSDEGNDDAAVMAEAEALYARSQRQGEEAEDDDDEHDDDEDGGEERSGNGGRCNDPAKAYNALQQALQRAASLLHEKHALVFAAHVALLGCATLMAFEGHAAAPPPPSPAPVNSASGPSQSDSDDGRAGTAAMCARLSAAPPHVKTAVIGHTEASLASLKVAQYQGEFNKAVALLRKLRAACL